MKLIRSLIDKKSVSLERLIYFTRHHDLRSFSAKSFTRHAACWLFTFIRALWHDGKEDWESAHEIAQSAEGTKEYDRIHAYLHRKEGDQWNAGYWYRRAGATMPSVSLAEEWESLVRHHLEIS